MKISVIIPVYNAQDSIFRCLDSVRNQTFCVDYEVIVINDGSTDASLHTIEQYKSKYPDFNLIVITKLNGGVASARNRGLQRATGDYIALLDSDDAWIPEKIKLQMDVLEKNPQIDYVGSNLIGSSVKILGKSINKLSPISFKLLFIKWYPQTSTVLFKRNIIDSVGYYDESMTHGEDGQYLLRICAKHTCWFMPNHLVYYGVNNKKGFGHSGLSANIKAMHKGQMQILSYALKNKLISCFYYTFCLFYEYLKYLRRIVVTVISKRNE